MNDNGRSDAQPFRPTVEVNNYFGGCTTCGGYTGVLNIGRSHWYVCEDHGVKWNVGANLFANWRQENEAIWRANAVRLSQLSEVEPLLARNEDTDCCGQKGCTPANPLHVQGYDVHEVAATMERLWNKGMVNPELANRIKQTFPGISLVNFNKAADIAWTALQASAATAWAGRLSSHDDIPF